MKQKREKKALEKAHKKQNDLTRGRKVTSHRQTNQGLKAAIAEPDCPYELD